jgi:RNA polymerase sigma-70 factor (ECF subfamily)
VNNRYPADLTATQTALASMDLAGCAESNDAVDTVLIRRIMKQDQQALETLYHRYYQRLARFIYRIAGQSDALEEIINDTLFVVWSKAATYNGSAKPSTWIFGIAYNKALKSLKSQYREQAEFDSELMETVENTFIGHVRSDAEKLESANWFACAFDQLPAEQRATIELTYYHDMSYQDIAVLMECSENTVKTRMFHARKKLKSILPRLADVTPPSTSASEELHHETP